MLDKTETDLIAVLREDPRASNRRIAQELGISEVTVAARLRSLFERGLVRTTVKTDFAKLGEEILAYIDVYVLGREIDSIIDELCALPEVIAVTSVLGPAQLLIQVVAKDQQSFSRVILPKISAIDGVRKLRTEFAVEVVKYSVEYGRVKR